MTVGDFLKRIDPEKDKNKMLIFFDGEGWSNIMLFAESDSEIVIRADCSSPFSDEVDNGGPTAKDLAEAGKYLAKGIEEGLKLYCGADMEGGAE